MIIDSDFELDSEVAEDAAGEGGGGAEEERPDDDYDYDGYDYDDDEFDSQSYGYDSEVYVFDFSDSEYEGEAPPHLKICPTPKATVLKTLLFQVPRPESTSADLGQGPTRQQLAASHHQRLIHHAANRRDARA